MTDPRYSRLERYAPLGAVLPRWQASRIAVIGLGGLGGGLAQQLARMGAGSAEAAEGAVASGAKPGPALVLIDRDCVGPENLGHQALFTEAQAAAGLPKAAAAAEILRGINSNVRIEAHTESLDRRNIRALLSGCGLIFDGLDNYFTRLLINDYALATGTPYFYAGVVRGELTACAVLPERPGCLRCLIEAPPPPGSQPTCAGEGVFAPLLGVANMLQLALATQWLGGTAPARPVLYRLALPDLRIHEQALAPDPACPACAGRYEYLDGSLDHYSASACIPGRLEMNLPAAPRLEAVRAQLEAAGEFVLRQNAYALSAESGGLRYTLFASGRLVLEGSEDPTDLSRFALTYLGL